MKLRQSRNRYVTLHAIVHEYYKLNTYRGPSAFDVIMAAQRLLSRPGLPPVKSQPKHNKDILRNDVIRFLRDQDCLFKETEVSSAALSKPCLIHCGRSMVIMKFFRDRDFCCQRLLRSLLDIIDLSSRNIANDPSPTCRPQS